MVETTDTTMPVEKYCISLFCKGKLCTIIYKEVEGFGRLFVSLWPVTDFPQKCALANSHKGFGKMKLGFQVQLTGAAFLWTVFVSPVWSAVLPGTSSIPGRG